MKKHRTIVASPLGIWLCCLLACMAGLVMVGEVYASGRVLIDSRPQGARVMVEGAYFGRTPLEINLDQGKWRIELEKKGFAPLKETLLIHRGRPRAFRYDLQPVQRQGFLDIASSPSPARIFLNGVPYELTPRRISLKPGVYNLRLEKKAHHPFQDQIRIKANQTLRLHPKLDPKMAYATVTVTSRPAGARVFVRDRYYDVTPARVQLWRGEYTIRVEKDGFQTQSRQVRVGPRQDNRVAFDLAPAVRFGTLHLKSHPAGARVFIDGQFVDQTPFETRLKAGRHEIKIQKRGFVPVTAFADVPPGEQVRRKFDLTPKPPPPPRKGILRVTSYPDNAEVRVDDQVRGRTPLEIDLPPGDHQLSVRKKGFRPYRETVSVGPGALVPVRIQLIHQPPEIVTTTLNVLSNPNGKAFINGRYVGDTPASVSLAQGVYDLEVKRKGYHSYVARVDLTGGHQQVIAHLKPYRPDIPRISQVSILSHPERAKVFVDRRYYGTTPLTLDLPEGRHWVEIRHRDFAPYQQEIEVHDGRPLQIHAGLQWRGGVTPHYLIHQIVKEVLKP